MALEWPADIEDDPVAIRRAEFDAVTADLMCGPVDSQLNAAQMSMNGRLSGKDLVRKPDCVCGRVPKASLRETASCLFFTKNDDARLIVHFQI